MMKSRFNILFHLFLFCTNYVFCQNDSLSKPKKNHFFVFANAGYPIINRFNIIKYVYGKETSYWVKSKLKPLYVVGFEYCHKKFNIELTGSYTQSEFRGKDFEFNVMEQVGGSKSIPISIAKYNLYQKMNSNVFQLSLVIGSKFIITKKQALSANISISSNLIDDHYTSNYYSSSQLGYDTTKYRLIKNESSSENSSIFPFLGFTMSYNYELTKHFFVDCKLTSQFFYPYYKNDSYDPKDNAIMVGQSNERDVYTIKQNVFIAPAVGVKYKIY